MLARVGLEQPPEIGAARAQHDLVRREGAPIARQRHIDEVLLVPEMPEGRQDRRVEVVPSQRVLLLWGGVAPHWAKRRGNLYANDWAVY